MNCVFIAHRAGLSFWWTAAARALALRNGGAAAIAAATSTGAAPAVVTGTMIQPVLAIQPVGPAGTESVKVELPEKKP